MKRKDPQHQQALARVKRTLLGHIASGRVEQKLALEKQFLPASITAYAGKKKPAL